MPDRTKRLVVLDCCGQHFSKVIDRWMTDTRFEGVVPIEISPGQGWSAVLSNYFPAGHPSGPRTPPMEVVFLTSSDESLFHVLCKMCDPENPDRWFEETHASIGMFGRV